MIDLKRKLDLHLIFDLISCLLEVHLRKIIGILEFEL